VTSVSPELDTRFRAAAAKEGLLDVAYDVVESPLGELFVGVSERGLCVISYEVDPDVQTERLARGFGSRVLRSPRPVDPARRCCVMKLVAAAFASRSGAPRIDCELSTASTIPCADPRSRRTRYAAGCRFSSREGATPLGAIAVTATRGKWPRSTRRICVCFGCRSPFGTVLKGASTPGNYRRGHAHPQS